MAAPARHKAAPPRLLSAAALTGVRRLAPEDDQPETTRDPLAAVRDSDPCDWIESEFWIPSDTKPPAELIRLYLHQKAITRFVFTRREDGRFPFQTIVISSIKKSGKSTWCAACIRWLAETQVRYGDLYTIGNDATQAQDRSYRFVRESIELTPGYDGGRNRLDGRWLVFQKSLRCLTSRSRIVAIAVDAKGEAGGRPYASIWTELWGFEKAEAKKLWTEMTPVPTVPDSMRIVETYAGFEGESELLRQLYDRGKEHGRQLTNHELASVAARDVAGERYEDFLWAFKETEGDPDAPVPVWVEGRMVMYWDEGEEAIRNPTEQSQEYYAEEAKTLDPQEFERIHRNRWGTSLTNAIPTNIWNNRYDEHLPRLMPGAPDPMVLSCDAGSSSDCFAITAHTRHPDSCPCTKITCMRLASQEGEGTTHERNPNLPPCEPCLTASRMRPALRELRLWVPAEEDEGRVKFKDPKAFLGWCVENFNVLEIAYDPWQLEGMMQEIRAELGIWCRPFNQNKEREIADKKFYDAVIQGPMAWNLHDENKADLMRKHLQNANKKTQKDQESKIRFMKKAEDRKIDLLVAASMGTDRITRLLV